MRSRPAMKVPEVASAVVKCMVRTWNGSACRAAFARSFESKLVNQQPLMLISWISDSTFLRGWKRHQPFAIASRCHSQMSRAGCILGMLVMLALGASAQDFTLSMAPFNPDAIDPGGQSSSTVTLVAGTGFTGTVNLTCQVLADPGTTPPVCQMSPASVDPTGTSLATVTSTGTTSKGPFTVVVTGTGPSTTHQDSKAITILSVNADFTITIQTALAPSSVHAGSGGQGIVNINPLFGYTGTVTLSCASITPLVTIPPICTFNPNPVTVSGATATSQISISTTGPLPTTAMAGSSKMSYALWLPLPMFALLGIGTRGHKKRAWFLLGFLVLAGLLLLVPACNNSSSNTTTSTGITPNNTYTFTLKGVDSQGNVSSNTGTANVAPTVTLTVD